MNTINLVIRKELNAKLDALENEFNLLDEKYKNALKVIMMARNLIFDLDHMLPKNSVTEEERKRISDFIRKSQEVL